MTVKKWARQKYVYIYSKILKEKAPAEYIARGWAIGMFYGCLIPFGSKIGATLGTLLTNHFTIFILYPAQCYVGSLILRSHLSYTKIEEAMSDVLKHQDWKTLFSLGGDLIAAFFLGAAILTAVMTPLTYFGVLHLVRRYRAIKEKKKLLREAAKAR